MYQIQIIQLILLNKIQVNGQNYLLFKIHETLQYYFLNDLSCTNACFVLFLNIIFSTGYC